jgi:hypothetical protein
VKVLKPHLATDEALTRFQREAQLCSQLSHPNTIEIYDYGHTRDGRWYYAMEYLRGISLEDLVRRDGAMPLARVVHAFARRAARSGGARARLGPPRREARQPDAVRARRRARRGEVVDFGLIKQVRDPTRATSPSTRRSSARRSTWRRSGCAIPRMRMRAPTSMRLAARRLLRHHRPAAVRWPRPTTDIVYRRAERARRPLSRTGEWRGRLRARALLAACLEKDRELRPATIDAVRATLDSLGVPALDERTRGRGGIARGGAGHRGRNPLMASLRCFFF